MELKFLNYIDGGLANFVCRETSDEGSNSKTVKEVIPFCCSELSPTNIYTATGSDYGSGTKCPDKYLVLLASQMCKIMVEHTGKVPLSMSSLIRSVLADMTYCLASRCFLKD